MFFMPSGETISKYESDKNVSQNRILSAKSLIFPNMKKISETLSNSDAIARWSSITFFIHPACIGYCHV
jgi:hypothetical protein